MDLDPALTSAPGMIALCSIFIIANTAVIPLRFYARRKQGATTGPDDWMIVPSYISFLVLVAATLFGIQHHFIGYETPKSKAVVLETKEELEKLYLTFSAFSALTMGLTKISAIFFFRRVFCAGNKHGWFEYTTIVSLTVVALWTATFVILTFFECGTHIWAMWTPSIALEYCVYDYPILKGVSISDALLSFWLVVLPIPKVFTLHMSPTRKLAVVGVFLFALAGFGASVARMVLMLRILSRGQAANFTDDPYLVDTEGFFLYIFEAGMSLLAVNLPTLWYFHSKVKGGRLLRSFRSLVSLRPSSTKQSTLRTDEKPDSISSSQQTDGAYNTAPVIEAGTTSDIAHKTASQIVVSREHELADELI